MFRKKHIVVDVDETIADTLTHTLDFCNFLNNTSFSLKDVDEYNKHLPGVGSVGTLMVEFLRNPLSHFSLPPIPQAPMCLRRLWAVNFFIDIATARELSIYSLTLKWLQKHTIPFENLFIGVDIKKEELDGDILIDDKFETVVSWTQTQRHGIILNRPWNRNYNDPVSEFFHRVHSWGAAMRLMQRV